MGRLTVILLLWAFTSFAIRAQKVKLPFYALEAGNSLNTGRHTPFWLISNQFGKQSVRHASGYVSAGFETKKDSSRVLDYNYGFELFERFDGDNNFWIHQAYFMARYRFLCLRFGKKEETYGNQDSLSSGSVLWSENARPLPKLVLSTNGYTDIPFTKGYVQVNGLLSHGWFGKNGYVKNAYLHHKYLYIKLGGRLPVNISYGLQHYAMWAGSDPVLGSLPHGWDTYERIFFAREGDPDNPDTPENESKNRVGNHLGSRNYGIDIKLKRMLINLYYQTIFEDNSGRRQKFMPDGLWGVSLKTRSANKFVNTVMYERFRSVYQSGGIHHEIDGSTAVDDYFNHFLYRSGWTYFGNTIGTPLITSPVLSPQSSPGIINNRVTAHHIGCSGKIKNFVSYKILVTLSRNYGTYTSPFPETRLSKSVLLHLSNNYKRIKGFETSLQVAFDLGEMYGNNLGIALALRKYGMF